MEYTYEAREELVTAYNAAENNKQREAVCNYFCTKYEIERSDILSALKEAGAIDSFGSKIPESKQPKNINDASSDIEFPRIVEYSVEHGKTTPELEHKVVSKIQAGWQPLGGVAAAAFGMSPIGGNQYVQAMVKYSRE